MPETLFDLPISGRVFLGRFDMRTMQARGGGVGGGGGGGMVVCCQQCCGCLWGAELGKGLYACGSGVQWGWQPG